MNDPEVLISEGRHAERFHVPLGESHLAACGKLAQSDTDLVRVSLSEAGDELDRDPCTNCPFPDDWLGVDRSEGVIADGGQHESESPLQADLADACEKCGDGLGLYACVLLPKWASNDELPEVSLAGIRPQESPNTAAIGSRQLAL